MTAEELIIAFKESCVSEKIELDNLDEGWLKIRPNGDVVVENEHGAEFPVTDLSQMEIDIFEHLLG